MIQVTQFVAAKAGEYTMTDSVEVGDAIKLHDDTRAVRFSEEGFRWQVVKSKGAALTGDAATAQSGVWPVERSHDADRWLKTGKEENTGKSSKK